MSGIEKLLGKKLSEMSEDELVQKISQLRGINPRTGTTKAQKKADKVSALLQSEGFSPEAIKQIVDKLNDKVRLKANEEARIKSCGDVEEYSEIDRKDEGGETCK